LPSIKKQQIRSEIANYVLNEFPDDADARTLKEERDKNMMSETELLGVIKDLLFFAQHVAAWHDGSVLLVRPK
jgi:hypothetical protein